MLTLWLVLVGAVVVIAFSLAALLIAICIGMAHLACWDDDNLREIDRDG